MRWLGVVLLVLAGALGLAEWRFHLYERLVFPERFYFVTARGTQFYLEGEPFRFVGANTRLVHGRKERAAVDEAFAAAKRHGVRVVRQWVVGESASAKKAIHRPVEQYYFQVGPNGWQEESFAHLDTLLAKAADHGLKVVLVLVNNWRDYGGMPMYLHWAGVEAEPLSYARHDSFYTDPQARQWVKALAHKLVTRRNTVTGVIYRDDPTIFAWELVNEAGAGLDRLDELRAWAADMAGYIKGMDPHHMVGISFSFYERLAHRRHYIETFRLAGLDYCDVHIYPGDHHMGALLPDAGMLGPVLADLGRIGQALGKPMVVGEVGFRRGGKWGGLERQESFAALFEAGLAAGLAGVMVWSYSDPGWDDTFEINWKEAEHARVCSVMAVWGRRYAATPVGPRDDRGLGWDVPLREHVFEVEPVRAVEAGDTLSYRIPVRGYGRAQWINFGYWDGEKGFASVYAKDHGYFAYPFYAAKAETLQAVQLKVRLSTDFPPMEGADSLGRSVVTVKLNGVVLGSLLVRPQRYFGTVYELTVSRQRGGPLLVLGAGVNELVFEVEETAGHRNGIALLGAATSAEYAGAEMPVVLVGVRR